MSYYNSYDSRGGDSSSRRDYGSSSYGGGTSYGGSSGGYSGNNSYLGYGVGKEGGSSYGGGSAYGGGGGGGDFGSNLSNIDFAKTELVPFEKGTFSSCVRTISDNNKLSSFSNVIL